jgi:hypothetical protein
MMVLEDNEAWHGESSGCGRIWINQWAYAHRSPTGVPARFMFSRCQQSEQTGSRGRAPSRIGLYPQLLANRFVSD